MQVMEPAAGPFPPPCREGLECKHDEPARYLTDHLAELGGRDQNTDRPASELFGAPGWAEKSASVHGGLGRSGTWKPPPPLRGNAVDECAPGGTDGQMCWIIIAISPRAY